MHVLMAAALAASTAGGLPFIEDDYAKARVQARSLKRPIFLEYWAPW